MKEIIAFIGLLAFIYLIAWHIPMAGIHLNTGAGEHTGFVTAVDTNGLIWKTTSIYFKTDLSSSQEDRYCVLATPEVVERLRQSATQKERITIQYIDYLIAGGYYCSTMDVGIINSIK